MEARKLSLYNLIYAYDDPDDQLDILTKLLVDCIERHAPLTKTKFTRPPAPWMNNPNIKTLQQQRNSLRYEAHHSKDPELWKNFRLVKSSVKREIRKEKSNFYRTKLSSKNSKEKWDTIQKILKPPLRCNPHDVNETNNYFAKTAERTLHKAPVSTESVYQFIENCSNDHTSFKLRTITYQEVLKHLKNLRNDSSTGSDSIPVRYVKLISDYLASPLTHILNSFIKNNSYPHAWKLSRVVPLPKTNHPITIADYRPISIQTCMSKIFEKVVLSQLLEFIEAKQIYKSTVTGFRKGFNTGTALLKFRDDIKRAMKSGEITLAVMVDFSKAFDTVGHDVIIKKLSGLGFSKDFLTWTFCYLSGREQFVQIDDRKSAIINTPFGVPQGSILGPILFNLYVNDLSEQISTSSLQYADDTTLYSSCKFSDIEAAESDINSSLQNLKTWSNNNNLSINTVKTNFLLLSTERMASTHSLDTYSTNIHFDGQQIVSSESARLLGVYIDNHLTWQIHLTKLISSCYSVLSILKKLKHFTSLYVRKQLAEAFILSKLDYNDFVFSPLKQYQLKRLQRMQTCVCGFVYNRFASTSDVIRLNWLPIKERREYHLLKLTHKALHDENWPEIVQIQRRQQLRTLRSQQ